MLSKLISIVYFHIIIIYCHVCEELAWSAELPERKKVKTTHSSQPTPPTPPLSPEPALQPEVKMPENSTKEYDSLFSTPSPFNPDDRSKNDTGNAGGSRRDLGDVGNTTGAVSNLAGGSNNNSSSNNSGESKRDKDNEGFGLDNGKDVKGSLKVHIKLDLEADIRITAKIKGDIAIGLL